MAKKLVKKKEKKPNKIVSLLKFLGVFVVLLFIGLFSLYQYLHITEGFTIYLSRYNIQKEYARFLIDINDEFIDKMVMFEDVVRDKQSFEDYSDFEKEKLSDIIIAENSILSRLVNTPPTDANLDYRELHENISESYALYIQGQIMKMEYILQTEDGMSLERYSLGDSVTTLVGNFIIEYDGIANKVRETTYKTKYTVLDGFEYNLGTAEYKDIEKDENGNILINEDDVYLYLPENIGTATNNSSEEKEEITSNDLGNYIEDFLDLQNQK